MAKIYLVRHAESVANTQGIYQGITYDTGLSEMGRKQASALAARFKAVEIAYIIASPLKRTMQTAIIVSRGRNLDVIADKGIIETNHGAWEGKPKRVIQENWPWIYKKWQRFPSGTKFPGGEHFLETQKRVVHWWEEFCQRVSGNAVIVSHDNIIRVIVTNILNNKLNKIWRFHLQPTAVSEVKITKGKAELISLGDRKHLEGLEVDVSMHAL